MPLNNRKADNNIDELGLTQPIRCGRCIEVFTTDIIGCGWTTCPNCSAACKVGDCGE